MSHGRLQQPDRRSCGAAVLVVARMLQDAEFSIAMRREGAFGAEVLAAHRRTVSLLGETGRLQLPWLRAIGTPPWAVRRGLEQITGRPYRIRPARPGRTLHERLRAASRGTPVALYVGNRWLPRHVVLVTAADERRARVYDPAAGRVVSLPAARIVEGPLGLAGWDRPWLTVEPGPRPAPHTPA